MRTHTLETYPAAVEAITEWAALHGGITWGGHSVGTRPSFAYRYDVAVVCVPPATAVMVARASLPLALALGAELRVNAEDCGPCTELRIEVQRHMTAEERAAHPVSDSDRDWPRRLADHRDAVEAKFRGAA